MSSKSKSKSGRVQPIRATQPFQLLQQSQSRRSPCSSPTQLRSSSDPRVAHGGGRHRWSTSPDHRLSPDRCDRKSPISPSIKVSNRRSPSPSIRRAGSGTFDSIATPYLSGQWPRDPSTIVHNIQINYAQGMRDKTTQTPDWNVEKTHQQQQKLTTSSSKGQSRSTSISSGDKSFSQMRQQIRRIAKQSSSRHAVDKKERTPGNHTALPQLTKPQGLANAISIAPHCFGRTPRRQNSNEALNKEIDILFNNKDFMTAEPKYLQGITPPDGHRAPLPRSATRSMETQTFQEHTDVAKSNNNSSNGVSGGAASPGSAVQSQSPSPVAVVTSLLAASNIQPEQQQPQQQQHLAAPLQNNSSIGNNPTSQAVAKVVAAGAADHGISPGPKYASSPRPNNSYVFKREPPEGAESVKPFKENQDDRLYGAFPSCPDKNKVNFYPTKTNSAFNPFKEELIDHASYNGIKSTTSLYDFVSSSSVAAGGDQLKICHSSTTPETS